MTAPAGLANENVSFLVQRRPIVEPAFISDSSFIQLNGQPNP